MYHLLDNLRIFECASFIAAPSCSLHLQQMGAEVIRIDPIGGGPDAHRWPLAPNGSSLYWEGLNKGKRSVAIDLSRPQGRELAIALITAPQPGAGVFVTNFPKDGFLSHSVLSQRRSDHITVRVMGWSDGESGLDYTVNAAMGLPCMTGDPHANERPVNHVLPAWDLLTGAYAAFALLAAERHRCRTGAGQEITVPLSDVALASLGHMGQIAEVLTQGDRPRQGNDLFGAFGRDFATLDSRRIMVAAITRRQWSSLVKALQMEQAIAKLESELGVSFGSDEGLRFIYRNQLFPLFEQTIGALSLTAIAERFAAHDVCWSAYQTLGAGLENDPRLSLAGPLFMELEHPSGLRYPAPGAAATFRGANRSEVQPAPHLGEHTDAVLTEVLALSSAHIGKLHDEGIIAGAAS